MVLSPEDMELWRVTTGRRQRLEPGRTPLLLMLPRDGAYLPADRTDPSPPNFPLFPSASALPSPPPKSIPPRHSHHTNL